jgi:hypothetical protein
MTTRLSERIDCLDKKKSKLYPMISKIVAQKRNAISPQFDAPNLRMKSPAFSKSINGEPDSCTYGRFANS